jgi:hypothetical protein
MIKDFMGPPKDTEYTPSSELSVEDIKIMAGGYSDEQIKKLVNDLWRYIHRLDYENHILKQNLGYYKLK